MGSCSLDGRNIGGRDVEHARFGAEAPSLVQFGPV
jgi:hypothetical protein